MTQRSILAGANRTIIIKTGLSVTVLGQEGDMVTAETGGRSGLQLGPRPESEFARARAAVGEHVLFDLRLKRPGAEQTETDVIEVQMGGSGEVRVPFSSNVKVYAGKDIDVLSIRGVVDAYSGFRLSMRDVDTLGNASAGGAMSLDCRHLTGTDVEFKAGGDLEFHVADLTSARVRVKDLGGYWEARIGEGEKSVYLKSGGDVTLITDQKVEPLPPNFILGKIVKPSAA